MKIKDGHTYYIADARSHCGRGIPSVIWWTEDGRHTYDLNRAGEYSADEARVLCRHRGTNVAYRADLVRARAVLHVEFGALDDLKEVAP